MAVYKTLLEHPASAAPMGAKVKWPTEYVISTLRALNLAEEFAELRPREVRNALQNPMQAMGMNIFRPAGPDGWSEAEAGTGGADRMGVGDCQDVRAGNRPSGIVVRGVGAFCIQ